MDSRLQLLRPCGVRWSPMVKRRIHKRESKSLNVPRSTCKDDTAALRRAAAALLTRIRCRAGCSSSDGKTWRARGGSCQPKEKCRFRPHETQSSHLVVESSSSRTSLRRRARSALHTTTLSRNEAAKSGPCQQRQLSLRYCPLTLATEIGRASCRERV